MSHDESLLAEDDRPLSPQWLRAIAMMELVLRQTSDDGLWLGIGKFVANLVSCRW